MTTRTEYITENGIDYEVLEYVNGDRIWFLNEDLHREDGPVSEYADGARDWWWQGIDLTNEVQEQGIDQLSPEEIRFWLPILAAQKVA